MQAAVKLPLDIPLSFWSCGFFDGIERPKVVQAVEQLDPRHMIFNDGEELCRFGDHADCLWIIDRGEVSIRMAADDRDRHLLVRSGPCIVGEQGIVDGGVRQGTMVALGRVVAYAITRAALDALDDAEVKAGLWRNLAIILSRKLGQASEGRAALVAANTEAEGLLKRFVNEHGLSRARGRLRVRDDYRPESVIVWFSDLVGFGAVVQQVEIGLTARLVRECMQAQSDAIEMHGGFIDKFMGDGLMAYWVVQGGEVGRQRACTQALDAAFAAAQAVRKVSSPVPGHNVGLRIGLHAGHAISGNFGSGSRWAFTLLGDDVNLAARLEQAKDVEAGHPDLGPIRISESFHAAIAPEKSTLLPLCSMIRVKELRATIYSGPVLLSEGEV